LAPSAAERKAAHGGRCGTLRDPGIVNGASHWGLYYITGWWFGTFFFPYNVTSTIVKGGPPLFFFFGGGRHCKSKSKNPPIPQRLM
jgi:hypothetical protein